MLTHRTARTAVLAACVAGLTAGASSQTLLKTSRVIVAMTDDPVPDAFGTPIPNVKFGILFDDCALDEIGNVIFRTNLVDPMVQFPSTDCAILRGSSRSTLKLVARGGEQAPDTGPGVTLGVGPPFPTTLSQFARATPDGRAFWGALLYDGGVKVTSDNDDCLFGGPSGHQKLLVRESDIAPDTGGAEFSQAFGGSLFTTTGMNSNGVMYFQATLRAGTGIPPVVTISGKNNSEGLWMGPPGGLRLIARKSDPVQGLGGELAFANAAPLSPRLEINDANHLLFKLVLSATSGTPSATAEDDEVLMVHIPSPGPGNQVLVREGDAAPGTAGATFRSSGMPGGGLSLPPNCWLRTSSVIFHTELRGGDVVGTTNDTAIYRGGVGTLALVARKGEVAPGTGGLTWSIFGVTSMTHNVNGQVAIVGKLAGPGVTNANDWGLWAGPIGSLQLILREGDVAPGTGGSLFREPSAHMNDLDQLLVVTELTGGGSPGPSLWLWDATSGLRPVVLVGELIEVSPGVVRSVGGFSALNVGNTDGASMAFGHDGSIAIKVGFSNGKIAIMRILPGTLPVPYCSGDGTGTACPCSPTPVPHGSAGLGCPNNLFPDGASLTAAGVASITSDTLVLTATGMPNGGANLIYQGTGDNGGVGTVFGDGLRCANGTVARMKHHVVAANSSKYPDQGFGDNSISQRGGVLLPGNRYYQGWYRSANPTFCTPEFFNLTNGVKVSWAP